ncbi:hypothetical protein [Nocardia sp. alder85J]|uniref:hypothetical protein n=1 Tax=Nocardia sp. alder85J TaxID=2862949 RepID=UPI001CD62A76|nr:hypothetical protein [Nocardia sp. alder85J]MCX4097686.1 hypothetical protein [Nocardia sp. alder85J]
MTPGHRRDPADTAPKSGTVQPWWRALASKVFPHGTSRHLHIMVEHRGGYSLALPAPRAHAGIGLVAADVAALVDAVESMVLLTSTGHADLVVREVVLRHPWVRSRIAATEILWPAADVEAVAGRWTTTLSAHLVGALHGPPLPTVAESLSGRGSAALLRISESALRARRARP